MQTFADKIKAMPRTPYQVISEKVGVSVQYVNKIATGKRTPTRGKGLQVYHELKKLTENKIS